MKSLFALAAGALVVAVTFSASGPGAAAVVPECGANDLKLDLSEDNPGAGRFGVLVTLTNTAAAACALPQAPTFEFQNEAGIDIATGAAPKANVILAAGRSGYAHVTWSDGIATNGPCLDATKFSVHLDPAADVLSVTLAAHMCTTDVSTPLFTAYAFSRTRTPVLPAASAAP